MKTKQRDSSGTPGLPPAPAPPSAGREPVADVGPA